MKPYYERNGITIYHGDCREILPSVTADVVVTDPPYGIAHASNRTDSVWRNEVIANDETTALRDWVLANWGERPAIVFGTWKEQRPRHTRAVLIWDKGPASGMGNLAFPWKNSHEEIYVIGNGFSGYRGESVIKGFTVVTWASKGRCHPNEKPTGLLRELLKKTEGTVLDPFMGSGTTLRAAKDLGRKAIGIEIEERYCEIAAKRLEQEVLPWDVPA